MARHIHNAEMLATGQVDVRETQFNGDAPALFFLEPVGIDAGQGFYQGGFAVVDMSGSSQNNLFRPVCCDDCSPVCFPARAGLFAFFPVLPVF